MARAPMLSTGFSLLALLAAGYGLFMIVVYFTQSRLLYFPNVPSRAVAATPAAAGLDYEPVTLTTEDDVRLEGWFLPAPEDRRRGTLLFFHGNAGNISHRLDSLQIFRELGLATLIIDYRGYGASAGTPTEQGTYRDATAAWRYLTERRAIAAREIVVFGRSLGAAIAAQLASRHRPGALILESAFRSAPELAATLYPFLPVRRLARFHYSTETYLAAVDCPVLIVHSRDDEIIPFAHGMHLYAIAREPKSLLELRGGHNDGFLVTGPAYVSGLEAFLARHLFGVRSEE